VSGAAIDRAAGAATSEGTRREDLMPFRVSGKNIDIGEASRRRIGVRIAETLGKFFDGGYSGHATVGCDGFGFRTECAVHLDSGVTLQAEAIAADAYASADQAALRIEKRLRRYKRRLKDRPAGRPEDTHEVAAPSYVIAVPESDAQGEVTEFNPVIIAESTTALKRLSVGEAVMELDMTGRPSWCSGMPDTAESTWFTAGRMAISAGSIRRP
jgi:ribosomal subunit interface protein